MDSLHISQNNLFIIKEKIIKTDEVLKLLGEKNIEFNKLERKYKKLLDKLSTTQSETLDNLNDCSNKHIAWENEIKSLKNQNDLLEQKHNEYVNTSEIKFQTACQEKADLTKVNEKLIIKIEKLKAKNISVKNVTKLQETLNLAKEELKAYKLKHEELINNNNKTIADLQVRCKDLEEQRNCDLKQLVKARLDCDELRKTLQITKKSSSPDISELKLQELEHKLESSKRELDILKITHENDINNLTKNHEHEIKTLLEQLEELKNKINNEKKPETVLKTTATQTEYEDICNLEDIFSEMMSIPDLLTPLSPSSIVKLDVDNEDIPEKLISIATKDASEDVLEKLISVAVDTEDLQEYYQDMFENCSYCCQRTSKLLQDYRNHSCNKFKIYPRCQFACKCHNNLVYNDDSEEDCNLNPILEDYKRLVIENYFANKYIKRLSEKNNYINNSKDNLVNKKIFAKNKISKNPSKLKNGIANKNINKVNFSQLKYKRIIHSSESEEESSQNNFTNNSELNVNTIDNETVLNEGITKDNLITNSANKLSIPVISSISSPAKQIYTRFRKIKLLHNTNNAKRLKISKTKNKLSKRNSKQPTINKNVKRKSSEEINEERKRQKLDLFGSNIDSDLSSAEESEKSDFTAVIPNNNCDNLANNTIFDHTVESEIVPENICEKFLSCTNNLQQIVEHFSPETEVGENVKSCTKTNQELVSFELLSNHDMQILDNDYDQKKTELRKTTDDIVNEILEPVSSNIVNNCDSRIEEQIQNRTQSESLFKKPNSCKQNSKTIAPKIVIVKTTENSLKNKRNDISNIVYKKPVKLINLPLPVEITEEKSNKNNSVETENENSIEISSKTDKTVFKRPERCKDSETDENTKLLKQISWKNPVLSLTVEKETKEINSLDCRPKIDIDLAQKLISDVLTLKWDKNLMLTVVSYLRKYDSECVAKLIVDQAAKDFSQELDKTFTPPAPLLTESQQKVLVLINHLEKNNLSNINETFLVVLERKLLSETKVEVVHPLTRLYVAVCKLKYDIEKVRILCCNAAFYMGELLLPVMFIVLTMWGDILPMADNSNDIPLAVALAQVIQLKTCKQPGYNFTNLNRLLSDYYGYTRGAKSNDEIMNHLTSSYSENCSKTTFTAILILCRSLPNKWTYTQIKTKLLPLIEKFKNDNKPECTSLTINLIQRLIETFQTAEDLEYSTDIRNCIS